MKHFLNTVKIIFLGLLLTAGISYAWTFPGSVPPAGNVDTPINTGVASQTKNGQLVLGGLMVLGSVQVSPTAYSLPGSLLFGVNGKIGATQYCDQNGNGCFSTTTIASGGGGGGGLSGVQLLTTAGAGTWTVPAGVTTVKATIVGAGGGGADYGCGPGYRGASGGGGGAMVAYLSVTPGASIPYIVGAGGAGAGPTYGSNGASSTFNGLLVGSGEGGHYSASGGDGKGGVGGTVPGSQSPLTGSATYISFPGNQGNSYVQGYPSNPPGTPGINVGDTWYDMTGEGFFTRTSFYGGGGEGGCNAGYGGRNGVIMLEYGGSSSSGSSGSSGTTGGVSYTAFCTLDSSWGTPVCPATVTLGTQGPCDTGYTVQKSLGQWGDSYYSGQQMTPFLPYGVTNGTRYPWQQMHGNAYLCSTSAVVASAPSSSGVSTVVRLATSSTSWVVPTGVTSVKATIVGDGGGGGGGQSGDSWGSTGYGGGAGATAIVYIKNLTPGNTISYSIGNGGARSAEGYGYNGGNGAGTTFDGIFVGGGIGGHGGANGYLANTSGTVSLSQNASAGTASFWGGYVGNSAPASNGGGYGAGGIGADGYLPNLIPVVTGETGPSPASGSVVSGPGAGGNGMGAGGGGGGRRSAYGGSAGGMGAPGGIILEY